MTDDTSVPKTSAFTWAAALLTVALLIGGAHRHHLSFNGTPQ